MVIPQPSESTPSFSAPHNVTSLKESVGALAGVWVGAPLSAWTAVRVGTVVALPITVGVPDGVNAPVDVAVAVGVADAMVVSAAVTVPVAVDDAAPVGELVDVGTPDGPGVGLTEAVDAEVPATPEKTLNDGLAVGVGVAVAVAANVEMGSAPTVAGLHKIIILMIRTQLHLQKLMYIIVFCPYVPFII